MSKALAIGKAFCSTANLGPGFDTFGLALDRYSDLVRVQLTDVKGQVRIRAQGPHASKIPTRVSENSAGPPAVEMLQQTSSGKGLRVVIEKRVPVGIGLGSSGATAAACVKALDALLELNLSHDELVRVASLGEVAASGSPHADNVAASLLGGFVIVYGRNPVRTVSVKPPSGLVVVVVTPEVSLPRKKTRLARSLVPKTVRVQEAVHNIGRASTIAVGFAKGRIDLVGSAMEDEIAEPYRERLIPAYRAVKKAALATDAAGVAISGAGPSVVALVDRRRCDPRQVGRAMVREFSRHNLRSRFFVSKPAPGATVLWRG